MILAIILAVLICLVLLYIVYKHMPRKNIFALFCCLLAALLGLTAYMFKAPEPISVTTEYQQELAKQQVDFDGWYTKLKKDMYQIDYIWQQYHNAIDCYNEETVDLDTTHQQLEKLEKDSQRILNELKLLEPPGSLDEKALTIANKLLDKVQDYTQAQFTAIHRSCMATDRNSQTLDRELAAQTGTALQAQNSSEYQERIKHKNISQQLNHIMLTESPEGLFIANEITAIRQFFKLSEEQ